MYNRPKRHIMKKCTKCLQEKEYSNFYKKSSSKDGYTPTCIPCRSEYNQIKKEHNQIYYQKNKEKYQINSKKYYQTNQLKVKEKSIEWQRSHPKRKSEIQKKWNQQNLSYFRIWRKNKWDNDPLYKIRIILGNRLNEVLKKHQTYKNNNVIKLLGCSLNDLKLYISHQLLPEMSWENHGTIWEIDHIKPCASFNLIDIDQQKECFHYTNLQPLFKTTEIAENFGYVDQIGNRNKSNK